MKTLMIVVAGMAVGGAIPANAAHDVQDALRRADQAHAITAELMNLTGPHSRCSASWNHVARLSVEADEAAAFVQARLATGDYCAARDAADRLKDIAEHLQDDAEDLDVFARPFAGGPDRQCARQVEQLADDLEDVAGDLRRDTKDLDENRFVGPPIGGAYYGPAGPAIGPVPPGPAYGGYPGGRTLRPYGNPYYGTPSGGYGVAPSYQGGSGRTLSGSFHYQQDDLGPGFGTPPADVFRPGTIVTPQNGTNSPVYGPTLQGPVFDDNSSYGGVPSASAPAALPPGLEKQGKTPPGHYKKIQKRQTGPSLLPPSASAHGTDEYRR